MEGDIAASAILVDPVLPSDIADYKGLPRSQWITKCVLLKDDNAGSVAIGICHNVCSKLVLGSDGPLGPSRVAVQIVNVLVVEERTSDWMFILRAWNIMHAFYDGASLYDHDQVAIYKKRLEESKSKKRASGRLYEYSGRPKLPMRITKAERLLSTEDINLVSSHICCKLNYVQPFPREKILAVRNQMWRDSDVRLRTHVKLDIHKQFHNDGNGNRVVTLEGINVCSTSWQLIMGVSRATFFRYAEAATSSHKARNHGNYGSKKPREHTVQAIATLRCMLEKSTDHMPHRSTTIPTRETVVTKTLPSSFKWKDTLLALNSINSCLELKQISKSGLSRIVNTSFPEYEKKRDGDNFARCGQCDRLKSLRASSTRGLRAEGLWDTKLNEHNALARAHRELYYANRNLSISEPEKVLTIIHDKMDHSKTTSPHLSHKNKSTEAFMKLPVSVTGIIAHGHGDIRYAHYGLDLYPTDSNHTVGSVAKVLRDLEDVPKFVSRQIFPDIHASPLSEAVLEGGNVCNSSLPPPPKRICCAKSTPSCLASPIRQCMLR
jgi:hypothetical protein